MTTDYLRRHGGGFLLRREVDYYSGVDRGSSAAWVMFLLFLWGSLLFALGVIGIYVGRTYKDVRGRPHYIIKDSMGFDE